MDGESPAICTNCRSATCADGWKVCGQCYEAVTRQRIRDRKQREKEGRQRVSRGATDKSLLSADHDEQIGGQSRCVRAMEDNA